MLRKQRQLLILKINQRTLQKLVGTHYEVRTPDKEYIQKGILDLTHISFHGVREHMVVNKEAPHYHDKQTFGG